MILRRCQPSALRLGRSLAILALFLALALQLAGCGKKGPPTPPPGASDTYPRSYPRE